MGARIGSRRGIATALLGLVFTLAVGVGTAGAQPTIVSPANGASFARNASSIPFTVDLPSGADDATIQLGTSPAINGDGSFVNPVSDFFGLVSSSPGTYSWAPFEQAAGTYYWDATSFVCDTAAPYTCSYEISPVQSIVLTSTPSPAPATPKSGTTEPVSASTAVAFTPNAQFGDTGLQVVFSTSSAVAADGVLAQQSYVSGNLTDDEGVSNTISVAVPASLDVPGTIYWQPVRINCYDNPTQPCDVPGPVSTLTLIAPRLRVQIAASTTVRINKPRVAVTVSCNEACSGKVAVRSSDSEFDLRPAKFSLNKAGKRPFAFTYRGAALAALAGDVSRHGEVALQVIVTASSTDGGGRATAIRKLYVRPKPPPPPPPGPDAGLTFSGNGIENLGPISVPVNSTLIWNCSGCGVFAVVSGISASDNYIGLDTTGQSSGQTYVDAGTYPNVEVTSDGSWAITFVPAG